LQNKSYKFPVANFATSAIPESHIHHVLILVHINDVIAGGVCDRW